MHNNNHRQEEESAEEEQEDEVEQEREDVPKNRLIEESAEQLSFVKVEETTGIYSSEEAFEFLNKPRIPLRTKEDNIPEVIIEPYPDDQLMDTDNDLPISIGVPIIGELPQQIKLSTGGDDEQETLLPGYHHFDIDNREVETMDGGVLVAQGAGATKEIKTVRKLKKSRGGKKQQPPKRRLDRDEQFADIIFENADNLLVKNPSISLEVPVLDFNFNITSNSTSTTMEPKLNFTNETTLLLEEEPIGE